MRATFLIVFAFCSVCGCYRPQTYLAADGQTMLPNDDLREHLPCKERPRGVLDEQSLYVRTVPHQGRILVDYIRFWDDGRALGRKFRVDKQEEANLTAHAGRVVDGWLPSSEPGVYGVFSADAIAWCVDGDALYIGSIAHSPGGKALYIWRGRILEDRIVFEDTMRTDVLTPKWQAMPKRIEYIRQRVGPMVGEPTW